MQTQGRLLDVRSLPETRESIAYKDGGLFPVLTLAPDGTIVAVLRGGAGHLGLRGRIEVIRSQDGGVTWSPPAVVADSDHDDRNPAFGTSSAGTLILSYHRQGSYDAEGNWARGQGPTDIMVTRSHDGGLTWEKPYRLNYEPLHSGSPFGKIVALPDGTLLLPIYGRPVESILGDRMSQARGSISYVLRSRDDGQTWDDPSVVGINLNETGLVVLPSGDVVAVMRGDDPAQALHCSRSSDGGRTWSDPVQITGSRQHPADLVALSNGDILVTYGNRNPPYRVEGLLSRDGGRTWLDCLLTFTGALYGYNVEEPRPTDLGYPSSVVRRGDGWTEGVTMYYYNPSLNRSVDWGKLSVAERYDVRGYYAIAVAWDEDELLAAIDRVVGRR